jgi:hypothetical protein
VAVDRSNGALRGNLYLVWQDGGFTGTSAIAFSRSSDGGKTWSTPVRVDDAGSAQAFNASVDVDTAGRIAVTWTDFRNDTATTSSALADTWVRFSTDGGMKWTASQRITPTSYDIKKAPQAGGYFLGDYAGLDHAGSIFRLDAGVTKGSAAPNSDIIYATAN